jgi:peptidoglycan/LPS O-acetylase OafA/YrhL
LRKGWLGAPVFFVLSGFVIARTIGSRRVDGRFVGRFMLRRWIRLGPPYWASLAAVVAVDAILARGGHHAIAPPSFAHVLAHLGCLQDLLGVRPISVVYWTLCLEVQLYLLLVLLAWARRGWLPTTAGAVAIAWPLFGLPTWPGSFLPVWHAFLLGSSLFAIVAHRRGAWGFALLLGLGAITIAVRSGFAGATDEALFSVAALATAGLLLVAIRTGRMATWGAWRPLRWLGETSYSLYLMHGPVMVLAFVALTHAPGPRGHAAQAAWLVAVMATVLWVARLAWRFVEVPSQQLARRIQPVREIAAPAVLDGQTGCLRAKVER